MTLNLDGITSPQDLKAIVQEVRAYSKWFSQNDIKTRTTGGAPAESLAVSPAAALMIHELAVQQNLNQKGLDELIYSLEDYEAKAPRITITLAAVPPGSLKKTLLDWCRTNIQPNILVDFRFNSTILGGMVVKYGSHIYDWSFRRQILDARGKFPEVLRRV